METVGCQLINDKKTQGSESCGIAEENVKVRKVWLKAGSLAATPLVSTWNWELGIG